MTNKTNSPALSAELILQEIENGSFQNWTVAEKALKIDSIEYSKLICARHIADGDLPKYVRIELSIYHQRIYKALLLVKNQPVILPYQYTEVRYAVKEEPALILTDNERPNYQLISAAVLTLIGVIIFLFLEL